MAYLGGTHNESSDSYRCNLASHRVRCVRPRRATGANAKPGHALPPFQHEEYCVGINDIAYVGVTVEIEMSATHHLHSPRGAHAHEL